MRDTIDASEVAELTSLYRQLPSLIWEATITVRPDESGQLTGEQLRRFRDAEVRASQIIERIREIAES